MAICQIALHCITQNYQKKSESITIDAEVFSPTTSAAHAVSGEGGLEQFVGLHHATVGEVAIVFIRIASPR